MMNILCYSAKKYDKKYFDKFSIYNFKIDYVDCSLSISTVELAKNYDGICIFVNDECDKNILQELHSIGIKCILLRCAGYNNVDIEIANELNISVARVPKYSPHAVAEHTVGLLLCLNRKIHKAYNRIRENNFSLNGLIGFDLYQKTIGVIGYGEIGKAFADILFGFGCEVIVYDPYVSKVNKNHKLVNLEYLIVNSDIISLHCPLSKNNYHLIDEIALSKMKPNITILNTSRGALIDTKAIIKSLKDKKISGLAIDVYEEEASIFFEDHSEEIIDDETFERLSTFPNVLITGHQAFLTDEALSNIAKITLDNANRILNGIECENIIA